MAKGSGYKFVNLITALPTAKVSVSTMHVHPAL